MSRSTLAKWPIAALALMLALPAYAQLYGTSPFQNSGGDNGALYRFDADTGAYVAGSGIQVTLAGFTITGINSVTLDPTNGQAYMILKVTGVSGRVLATANLITGVATQIGNLGDNFASISFRADGQLFGVTGDGATVPETLYLIDKTNATKVVATALGNGADGEVIAFNPTDNSFYHWSGNGTIVFEKILATAPYTVTNIPIIGATNGETFGAVWDACRDVFIGSNIGSRFNLWNPNGTVGAQYGANPDDIRGMALIGGYACNVDLTLGISALPAAPTAGNPVTLTVNVLNNGTARALVPSVALSIAANITGLTTTGCAEDPAGVPTCTLPTLYQGESASIAITGTFGAGAGTSTATVTTASDETAPADNTDSLFLGGSINVTPTSGLVTTEAGGSDTFSVVLGSQPTANVSIPVSSSDTGEGTVSTASLVFSAANWNIAQTVTVTGVDDFLIDGAQAYTIVLGPSSSADAGYNGIDPSDVSVTNNDNDVASVTVTPPSPATTSESGGTAFIGVVLNAQPTADVSFPVSSSDTTEGTVSASSATFTPANWSVVQNITVTGVDDFQVDGDVAYTIILGATTSADANFNGLNPVDVAMTNIDNDVAGGTVVPTSGLTTTEAGGAATFSVVLTAQPTADVSIALSSSDTTEAAVAPVSLTFTSANWNIAQVVTVTGVDDIAIDGDQSFTIVLAPTVSSDSAFNGIDLPDVSGVNLDDDVPAVPLPGPGWPALFGLALLLIGAARYARRPQAAGMRR